MSYANRRCWSDQYIPATQRIVAEHFNLPLTQIVVADFELDTKQATDLLAGKSKIAVRVRRPEYRDRYYGQFTVRTSGALSELDKLQWGLCDYVFYAYADEAGGLSSWWLMETSNVMLARPVERQTNGSDAQFVAFQINPSSVVASSEPYPYNVLWN